MRARALLRLACVAIPFTVAGCDVGSVTHASDDDPPTGLAKPQQEPDPPSSAVAAAVRIDALPVVTLSPSEMLPLPVTLVDSLGARLDLDVELRWSSEIRERVEVDGDGVLHAGEHPGHSWVFVDADGLRDSVGVWIQPPEAAASSFEITLHFDQGIPSWWAPALEAAAERWERAIRAELPEVAVASLADQCEQLADGPPALRAGTESGVRIFVRISNELPTNGVPRATGGVCAGRGLPEPTAVVGLVTLNAYSLGDDPPGDLAYLAHHELGHALGLVGAVQGEEPAWLDVMAGEYRGHLALFGRYLDGEGVVSVFELGSNGHWPFADLMGTPRANTISHATIGALMDLGYPAAWYGSGPIGE